MESQQYRGDLSAAFARIAFLEQELALFRSDPSYERVDVAEEELERAKERRGRLQRILPKTLILSFVCLGAFAFTDSDWAVLRLLALGVTILGAASGLVCLAGLLVLLAQGPRPARIRELERNVRLAKGDIGARRARVRVEDRFELEARAELDEELPSEGLGARHGRQVEEQRRRAV